MSYHFDSLRNCSSESSARPAIERALLGLAEHLHADRDFPREALLDRFDDLTLRLVGLEVGVHLADVDHLRGGDHFQRLLEIHRDAGRQMDDVAGPWLLRQWIGRQTVVGHGDFRRGAAAKQRRSERHCQQGS